MSTYTYNLDVRFTVERNHALSFMSQLLFELGPVDGDCTIVQDTDHIYVTFSFEDATFDWRLYARINNLHSALIDKADQWQYKLSAYDEHDTQIMSGVQTFGKHASMYMFFAHLTETVENAEGPF